MQKSDLRVAIVGVGLVGIAIAERLLKLGYHVTGFDISAKQCDTLRRLGGQVADSATAAVRGVRRLILSLPTSAIVGVVLDEIEPELAPECVVVDTTTGAPDDAIAFSKRLSKRQVDYLDATVGGSSAQVRARQAIVLCGGERGAFEQCADIFEACAKKAYYVGPAGSGVRMKLVLNLVLGLNRAVLAEGLQFARSCSIDPNLALEILKAGPAYSLAMDTKGHRMLTENFEPEARLSQHLKDVRLILACGKENGAALPLSEVHRELLESVEAAGFGDADNSAIIKSFQKEDARRRVWDAAGQLHK